VFQFRSQSLVNQLYTKTHRNTLCIEVIKYSKAGPKLQCSSSWLSKSMQLKLPKLLYLSFLRPCVQIGLPLSHDFVRRQHPTICWNYRQHKLSRAKLLFWLYWNCELYFEVLVHLTNHANKVKRTCFDSTTSLYSHLYGNVSSLKPILNLVGELIYCLHDWVGNRINC
jgi:hypothetical protein